MKKKHGFRIKADAATEAAAVSGEKPFFDAAFYRNDTANENDHGPNCQVCPPDDSPEGKGRPSCPPIEEEGETT